MHTHDRADLLRHAYVRLHFPGYDIEALLGAWKAAGTGQGALPRDADDGRLRGLFTACIRYWQDQDVYDASMQAENAAQRYFEEQCL